MIRRALTVIVATLVVTACTGSAAPSPSPTGIELTVYGAASLKGVLDAAKVSFEAANPGLTLIIATDSSAALAAQIEQGAPADVFLSADIEIPQRMVDDNLTAGEVVVFAANWLALIAPIENPGRVTSALDLSRPGLRIIAAGDEVPISRYAALLVRQLAADPGYPMGFAESYAANVVSREDNVKSVVAKIELGEGDAAFVYSSDAKASSRVATVPLPAAYNVMAIYGAVVPRTSRHRDAAEAFLAWLGGPQGRKILVDAGLFIPPA